MVDSLAQVVVDRLVAHGKALFEEKDEAGQRTHTNAQIHQVLQKEQEDLLNKGDFMNSLLSEDSM